MKLWIALLVAAVVLAALAQPAFAGGPRVFVDIGVFAPYPVYAYPVYPYPYPAYVYPAPPVIIERPAPLIVESPPAPPAPPPPPQYWYYCEDPKGYYPYVTQCPRGWMQVVPQTQPVR